VLVKEDEEPGETTIMGKKKSPILKPPPQTSTGGMPHKGHEDRGTQLPPKRKRG
jgi:hypothetical protein